MLTTVGKEGMIALPKAFRADLGLTDGAIVSIEVVGETLVLHLAALTPTQAVAFFQNLASQQPLTPGEEDEAFANGVAADFEQGQAEGRFGPPPDQEPRIGVAVTPGRDRRGS